MPCVRQRWCWLHFFSRPQISTCQVSIYIIFGGGSKAGTSHSPPLLFEKRGRYCTPSLFKFTFQGFLLFKSKFILMFLNIKFWNKNYYNNRFKKKYFLTLFFSKSPFSCLFGCGWVNMVALGVNLHLGPGEIWGEEGGRVFIQPSLPRVS